MNESEFFKQVYSQLSPELQSAFDQWCNNALHVAGGEDIIRNIKAEQYLDHECFEIFISFLADSFLGQVEEEKDAKQAYIQTCQIIQEQYLIGELFCRGRTSEVIQSAHLHRYYQKSKLKQIVSLAYGNTSSRRYKPNEAWKRFKPHFEAQDEEYQKILRGCTIPYSRTTFAYHNPDPKQSKSDPLANQNVDACLNVLGLAEEWGYTRNKAQEEEESSWKIIYLSHTLNCHVPTIADTFYSSWNPYFQPTQDSESPIYGWTRPINFAWGTKGQPEVIHWGWELESEEDPGGFLCIENPEVEC